MRHIFKTDERIYIEDGLLKGRHGSFLGMQNTHYAWVKVSPTRHYHGYETEVFIEDIRPLNAIELLAET